MIDSFEFFSESIEQFCRSRDLQHVSDKEKSVEELLAENREVVLAFDAMVHREGAEWWPRRERFSGLDQEDTSLDAIQWEFLRCVASAAAEPAEVLVERTALRLSNKHECWYMTSLGNSSACFPVAQYCVLTCNGSTLWHMMNDIFPYTRLHRLTTRGLICDGGADNRGLKKIMRARVDEGAGLGWKGVTARDILPAGIVESLAEAGVDVDTCVAVSHWTNPFENIFFIFDPPHVWKRQGNAADDSDPANTNSKRDLWHPRWDKETGKFVLDPMSLTLLKRAKTSIYKGAAMDPYRKVTDRLFNKTSYDKMRVPLAVRGFGATAWEVLNACLDEGVNEQKASYMQYVALMNQLVDTLNGRRGKCDHQSSAQRLAGSKFECGPITNANKEDKLRPLHDAIKFVALWKKNLARDELGLTPEQQAIHFFPKECWEDFQTITVGVICACHNILKKHPGMSLFLRKFSQDVVEHHFAQLRQSGGATRNVVASTCTRGALVSAQHRQGTGGKRGKGTAVPKRNCEGGIGGDTTWQQPATSVAPIRRSRELKGSYSTFCM
jgi:hypothetical protein